MGYFINISLVSFCASLLWFAATSFGESPPYERPCATRQTTSESLVCVCNMTYCDDVFREHPAPGEYIAYISSQAGSRFRKIRNHLKVGVSTSASLTLELHPDQTYQTIEGFGGAVTDAAGINWRSLPDELQKSLVESYFSEHGIEYNMLRVPIGGCDFSTHPYAYNELPEDDIHLSNYSLAHEDYEYKIPMIRAIMDTSRTPVHIMGTTWSPPKWMKTNGRITGFGSVKKEYYQTYADYHEKFLEKYELEQGIPIWGITTTNEPINSGLNFVKFNDVGWSPDDMGEWIEHYLGPTIRNSTFKDLKIMTVDDQRYTIPYWFSLMIRSHPKVLDYIDGVAVHYYGDQIAPPYFLSQITEKHGKFVLNSESSEGSYPWDKGVELGAWRRARHYINDILQDLNYSVVGWLDWNLCLNFEGGPNWVFNFVDSPIIVFPENKEFIKQPLFYAMGHFSKFIPRGSVRIKVVEEKQPFTFAADNVAFITPQNTIVVVLYNDHDDERTVTVKVTHSAQKAVVTLEPHSVLTLEFPHEK